MVMRFETEEWVIRLRNNKFKATHIGCGREATIFNKDGHASPLFLNHDENSYCVCKCMIISPRLKDFKIIAESIEEK